MKIAYIGSFGQLYDEEGIAKSLERLGHTVVRFEENQVKTESLYEIMQMKPDFVLMAKLKIGLVYRKWFVDECRKNGIKTVCWVPDLYWGTHRESLLSGNIDAIFRCDLVCTPDGGNDARWEERGINHRLLRQGIYDGEIGFGQKVDRDFDIVFIGCHNQTFSYRDKTMGALQKRYGDSFKWFGRDNTHQVRDKNLNNLFASVKIVIGDSVYSDYYWSNRIYETIGRGGFIIHPNIKGLEKEFWYYHHFVPYDYGNYDSLFEKIDYFMDHESDRMKIIKSGMECVKENHTLLHRCKRLIKYVEEAD